MIREAGFRMGREGQSRNPIHAFVLRLVPTGGRSGINMKKTGFTATLPLIHQILTGCGHNSAMDNRTENQIAIAENNMNGCMHPGPTSYRDATVRVEPAQFMFEPEPNIETPIFENEHTRVTRITVPSGGHIALRRLPGTAVQWFITAGRAEVTVGRMARTLWKGDSLFVPPGVVHGLENKSRNALVLTEVRQR